MWMVLILVFVCGPQQSQAQLISTLQSEEGKPITLSCGLAGSYSYPAWRGPPSLILYTNLGDTSGTINPAAPAVNRLQYASNNQDLLLSSTVIADSGVYKCTYTGLGDHTITLTVSEKGSTTTISPTNSSSVTNTPSVNTTAISTAANPPATTPKNPCDRTCIIIIIIIVPIFVVSVVTLSAFVCCWLRHRSNIKKNKDSSKGIHSNLSYGNDIVMTSDTRDHGENNRL